MGSNPVSDGAGFRPGLPADRLRRLLKFYRPGEHGWINRGFPWRKTRQRRLSPEVPGVRRL